MVFISSNIFSRAGFWGFGVLGFYGLGLGTRDYGLGSRV